MPPRDPRLCPALERALPSGDVPGGEYRGDRSRWLVLFGDGEYRPVTVLAWWTDDRGNKVVQMEWYADGSGWEGAYMADEDKMCEAADGGCDRPSGVIPEKPDSGPSGG